MKFFHSRRCLQFSKGSQKRFSGTVACSTGFYKLTALRNNLGARRSILCMSKHRSAFVKVGCFTPVTNTYEVLQPIVRTAARISQNYALQECVLSSVVSQDNATNRQAERGLDEEQRDDLSAREKASTGRAQPNLGSVPN